LLFSGLVFVFNLDPCPPFFFCMDFSLPDVCSSGLLYLLANTGFSWQFPSVPLQNTRLCPPSTLSSTSVKAVHHPKSDHGARVFQPTIFLPSGYVYGIRSLIPRGLASSCQKVLSLFKTQRGAVWAQALETPRGFQSVSHANVSLPPSFFALPEHLFFLTLSFEDGKGSRAFARRAPPLTPSPAIMHWSARVFPSVSAFLTPPHVAVPSFTLGTVNPSSATKGWLFFFD